MSEPIRRGTSKSYLFLLAQPSFAVRRQAAERLRELGLRVVAQYGSVAIEAHAEPGQVSAARDLGLFSAAVSGSVKAEHFERLSEEQQQVVSQWNTRFDPQYRETTKDVTDQGLDWGAEGKEPPAPYSAIGVEDFLEYLDRLEERTGRRLRPEPEYDQDQGPRISRRTVTPEEFIDYERRLAKRLDDPTAAHHLSRLAWALGAPYFAFFERLDLDLLLEILDWFLRQEAACWKMNGEISVGVVFVESARSDGPRFGTSERNEICQEIIDGLNLLAGEQPAGNLSWVYDFQFTKIDLDDGDEGAVCDDDAPVSALEADWRNAAMERVSYQGSTYAGAWASVAEYREDMRTANRSAHAIVIFVTPYSNCWHAYASSGRVVLAKHDDWGNWGRSSIDRITAHEVAHLFGAADEYTGSGTPCSSCSTLHGCDRIPNGNCGACARPQQDCMMAGNHRRICAYTRGQIGWSTIFVQLTTADVAWAGTDDDVWLDIGDRSFVLDTPNHDDRERNNREGYAIWAPSVSRADISRVMIRKSPDGFAGGWRLRGVKVWHAGDVICNEPSINRWLEDDHRTWTGCVFDSDLVNTLQVKIRTADVAWAGTDDDVSIRLSGRNWNLDNPWHDDFERGHTDTFELDPGTGLHRSDINSVRIHKSPDGFAGGWKLGGVRVIANGTTLYDNGGINRWLEDDDRTWSDTF